MHPSVLEAQSKSEAVAQLTVALRESNVPHLRWSQAPPCLGQGEAGSADYVTVVFLFDRALESFFTQHFDPYSWNPNQFGDCNSVMLCQGFPAFW